MCRKHTETHPKKKSEEMYNDKDNLPSQEDYMMPA